MANILDTLSIIVTANTSRAEASLGRIGTLASRTLPLALAATAGAGVAMAAKLETSFAKIENLVGVSGAALDQIKEGVRDVSLATGQSQQSLSEAAFAVTSAGLRGAEALETLEAAAKASAIGLGDTTSIARATTAVLQAYGAENINAAKATDVLVSTIRAGNLEASTLTPNLGKVIPVAAQLGVTFEEVGANIAIYTRLGVSAEEATTGLAAALQGFLKPAPKAVKAAEDLETSFEELRESIRERGLAATMAELIELTNGNATELAKLFPNVRALRNVLGTAARQGEEYAEVLEDIAEQMGITNEGFENVADTTAFKLNTAINELKTNLQDLGAVILPVVNEAFEGLNDIFDAFRTDNISDFFKVLFDIEELEDIRRLTDETLPRLAGRVLDTGAAAKLAKGEIGGVKKAIDDSGKSANKLEEPLKRIKDPIEFAKNLMRDSREETEKQNREFIKTVAESKKLLVNIEQLPNALIQATSQVDPLGKAIASVTSGPGTLDELRNQQLGKAQALFETIAAGGEAVFSTLDSFLTSLTDNQLARLENRYNRERELIESSSLSEEAKQAALIKLEERTAKEKNRIRRKTAIAEKASAIFQSIINTALAVTKALQAGPAGPILAAIIGGLGAAQTAIIAGTPIPALAEGGLLYGDSLIRAGEYQNASINPEVIAPLDTLVGKIREAIGGGVGETEAILIPEGILVRAVKRGFDNESRISGT